MIRKCNGVGKRRANFQTKRITGNQPIWGLPRIIGIGFVRKYIYKVIFDTYLSHKLFPATPNPTGCSAHESSVRVSEEQQGEASLFCRDLQTSGSTPAAPALLLLGNKVRKMPYVVLSPEDLDEALDRWGQDACLCAHGNVWGASGRTRKMPSRVAERPARTLVSQRLKSILLQQVVIFIVIIFLFFCCQWQVCVL